jgi:hypothetical protein
VAVLVVAVVQAAVLQVAVAVQARLHSQLFILTQQLMRLILVQAVLVAVQVLVQQTG